VLTVRRQAAGKRKTHAALRDRGILAAARAVFVADPGAPISAVATRAGVGISALYRRFASKEALLNQLCREGLENYIAAAEAAWADDADPWRALCDFLSKVTEANTHALTIRVSGIFKPHAALYRLAEIGQDLNRRIFQRAKAAGVLRPGLAVDDLGLILEQLAAVNLGSEARSLELRRRYLAVFLAGIHSTAAGPLPGQPPSWKEVQKRWNA
jgi:AcrR family transcriptional regulator